jgi:hypothetical protein
MDIRDYAHAETILAAGRDKYSRTIGHNTWLTKVATEDAIGIVFHATRILTLHRDGALTLAANGWHTVTTATRFRHLLPSPWSVSSHRVGKSSEWWIHHGGYPILPFGDGLTLWPDEHISIGHDGPIIMTSAELYAERERIQAQRELGQAKRAARLIAEHDAGPYGTIDLYDWHTQTHSTAPKHHKRYDYGYPYDCPRCVAKDGAA